MNYRGRRVTTEIMLYADLKINDGGGIVHELGLEDLSVYKEKLSQKKQRLQSYPPQDYQ